MVYSDIQKGNSAVTIHVVCQSYYGAQGYYDRRVIVQMQYIVLRVRILRLRVIVQWQYM